MASKTPLFVVDIVPMGPIVGRVTFSDGADYGYRVDVDGAGERSVTFTTYDTLGGHPKGFRSAKRAALVLQEIDVHAATATAGPTLHPAEDVAHPCIIPVPLLSDMPESAWARRRAAVAESPVLTLTAWERDGTVRATYQYRELLRGENARRLREHVRRMNPGCVVRRGFGPIIAAGRAFPKAVPLR
jgi:hypothetical protein